MNDKGNLLGSGCFFSFFLFLDAGASALLSLQDLLLVVDKLVMFGLSGFFFAHRLEVGQDGAIERPQLSGPVVSRWFVCLRNSGVSIQGLSAAASSQSLKVRNRRDASRSPVTGWRTIARPVVRQ
jgi:hypothetical protein